MSNKLVILLCLSIWGCSQSGPEQGAENENQAESGAPVDAVSGASVPLGSDAAEIVFQSAGMDLQLEELARTGEAIWAMEFIGPNTMIFTERSGQIKLLRLDTGEIRTLPGGPIVLQHDSGGLFDVQVDPDFSANQLLYFTYVKPVAQGSVIALARAKYAGDQLVELVDLFVANNPSDDHAHWGSRVVMDADRFLYMVVGDRHVPNNAQNIASHGGKVIRLNQDGSVPEDNPYVGQEGAAPEIWSIGHRNPQGLLIHPETGELIEQEHGPTGGDEINVIQRGLNYGWPVITWGEEIWGGQKKEGTVRDGMEQPFKYFLPGIAPTGISFYTGSRYPGWRGDLFSSTLRSHVQRLALEGDRVASEEQLFAAWGERLRDVAQGPNGYLYLATESGAIARIVVAE